MVTSLESVPGAFARRLRRLGSAAGLLAAGLAASSPAAAIVGGTDLPDGASRPAVMVLNSRGGVCSAAVLAPEVVLTAAHCVAGGAEIRVHYRQGEGSPALLVPSAVVAHPGFDGGAVAGRRRSIDLALLRLSEPLPGRFTPAVLAVSAPAKGTPITVGGYGLSREGDARSTGTYRVALVDAVEPYGRSTILLWGAAPKGTRAGACEGDSGGLMAESGGAVAAVTSWAKGDGRAACGAMTQGVLVGPQRAWIDATLGRWGSAAAWR